MRRTRSAIVVIATLAAAILAGPALAEPTARASGNATVHAGPGRDYPAIAHLVDGERYPLERCTTPSREDEFGRRYADWGGESWCYIAAAGGWVDASYLVGSPAKVNVTPHVVPFDPLPYGIFR
ncbi:hypothetical protein [Devosia nitrariae]|uniref:SH3 domain-containing protein n=1 Tax=Devosia nitrariae TaxID=2071872 RepID=A0ABQ5VZ02_9HYPH|nr:hypothetical protein [Devosia nitrariae]GLQ52781.1 hypothetical protein GCM10010862_00390 [Devosia nitrariae]